MSKSFTLSVDMLGSETKLNDVLRGLNQSLLRNLNYKFLLFGSEKKIKTNIDKYKNLLKVSEIINCDSFISMDDKPSEVLRSKENSSMLLAINSVKDVIKALLSKPKLLERPVLIKDGEAIIGRPPEDVLQLL